MGAPGNAGGVAQDYSHRLTHGRSTVAPMAEAAASRIFASHLFAGTEGVEGVGGGEEKLTLDKATFDAALLGGKAATVVVQNPLGWEVRRWVRLSLPRSIEDASVSIGTSSSSSSSEVVPSDVLPGGTLVCDQWCDCSN